MKRGIPKQQRASTPKARQAALKSVQKLRRLEEALPSSGLCRCISCGRLYPWNQMDGGHFIPRTIKITELDKQNIWPQCKHCNGFLEGNTTAYEINLRKVIGDEAVNRLIALRMAYTGSDEYYELLSDTDKRLLVQKKTADDYIQIKRDSEKKIRLLIKEKGIA